MIDKEVPNTPSDIRLAQIKNTIWWQRATDDVGVEKYAVYVDGTFHQYASLNQTTLTGLNVGQTYEIQVQSVDFVGRVSEKSEEFSLNFT